MPFLLQLETPTPSLLDPTTGLVVWAWLVLSAAAVWAASLVWVYRDAEERGLNGWLVALPAALIAWPAGLLIWFLLRPKLARYAARA